MVSGGLQRMVIGTNQGKKAGAAKTEYGGVIFALVEELVTEATSANSDRSWILLNIIPLGHRFQMLRWVHGIPDRRRQVGLR